MDPVSIIFYAVICGALGLAGPRLGSAPVRSGIGTAVGIIAAIALPVIRTSLFY